MSSLSIEVFIDSICDFNWDPSCNRMAVAITGLETPQARPRAKSKMKFKYKIYTMNLGKWENIPCLDLTNTYGTFLSSHKRGRWSRISKGWASAAITMNSDKPRFNAFVAKVTNRKKH